MEAILFVGIQAAGKSTFYARGFFKTHIRLNLDMLHTRHREAILLNACLEAKQPFVIDNTNPTIIDWARYVIPASAYHFRVIGYYFQTSVQAALRRNVNRSAGERIPDKGLLGTYKRLQVPTLKEGFDQLFYVHLTDAGEFLMKDSPYEL